MDIEKQLHEKLSHACYHLEAGDFEKVEDLLHQVSDELPNQKENDLIIQYYQIKIDLYRCTRRRELCLQLWNEMEKYCKTPMHKCIRLSGKALDCLMLNREKEAMNNAYKALKEVKELSGENRILALQVKGEVYRKTEDWDNAIKNYASIAANAR